MDEIGMQVIIPDIKIVNYFTLATILGHAMQIIDI